MAPYTRRQMIQATAAASVAGPAMGAATVYPDCSDLYVIMARLHPSLPADTPDTVAEFSVTGDKDDEDILRNTRLSHYTLRRSSISRDLLFEGQRPNVDVSQASLSYEFQPDAATPEMMVISWPSAGSEELSEKRAALRGKFPVTVRVDDGAVQTITAATRSGRSHIPLPWDGTHLVDGRKLEVRIAAMGFEMTALFDTRHLSPTIPIARQKANAHAVFAATAGGCKPACVMTSAAVDLLGRPDDCFELSQMRALRARFPERSDVVEAYIHASNDLLARGQGVALRSAILIFYALIVWPTALLMAARLYRGAGLYYLAGFTCLCRLFRVAPPPPPGSLP
ncbi:hypothetical protein [Dinoroseobacter sp. S124A]|uniref:hypothetical protein n=1 Tax=Dinoroseobacter sp. S124A TaxID=3415128 RepID=UPI003C797809